MAGRGGRIDAGNLKVGDLLAGADGASSRVVAVRPYVVRATVFNLTVTGPHTYQVAPAGQQILVHNNNCEDAAEAAIHAGGFSNSALEDAANSADRNGLTRAGRALQKHGDRPDSIFPRSSGSAEARNKQGLDQVKEILSDSDRTVEELDYVINNYRANGAGVRCTRDGAFMGFLEP